MVAHRVKWVGIEGVEVRVIQTLVQLEIEDRKAKGLGRPDIPRISREPKTVVLGKTAPMEDAVTHI